MNTPKIVLVICLYVLSLSACDTPNANGKSQPGFHTYTQMTIWGETTAIPISSTEGNNTPAFAITCREMQYCLSRANDICIDKGMTILSTDQGEGRAVAVGGLGHRSASILMQVQCN